MLIVRRDRAMTAVSLVLDIAFHVGRAGTVSAGEIADRLGLARRGMEPLLQALSRAGLLDSVRGPRGGYRLGRAQRDIRVAEIVAIALAEDDEQVGGGGPTSKLQTMVVDKMWAELDEAANAKLAALTLEDLLRRAAAAGLRRPASEPISFTI
jgi:Rrf2 family iron-sulfur cluster assembly transcriptional regulator